MRSFSLKVVERITSECHSLALAVSMGNHEMLKDREILSIPYWLSTESLLPLRDKQTAHTPKPISHSVHPRHRCLDPTQFCESDKAQQFYGLQFLERAMPSFDVVSNINIQEARNAVDQINREVITRYDFKDTGTTVEFKEKEGQILLTTTDKMRLTALQDITRQKLSKRGISLKSVTFEDSKAIGGDRLLQIATLKQSLTDEERKQINKTIKEKKLKVTSQIQGEQVRVTGKSRDELQAAITILRSTMTEVELQFINFRD